MKHERGRTHPMCSQAHRVTPVTIKAEGVMRPHALKFWSGFSGVRVLAHLSPPARRRTPSGLCVLTGRVQTDGPPTNRSLLRSWSEGQRIAPTHWSRAEESNPVPRGTSPPHHRVCLPGIYLFTPIRFSRSLLRREAPRYHAALPCQAHFGALFYLVLACVRFLYSQAEC